MQDFKKLRVYEAAFRLSRDVFEFMDDKKMISYRAKEQLLASCSSICANLAEMGAMDSINAQRQKLVCCIGESNETEYWLDLCNSLKVIPQRERVPSKTVHACRWKSCRGNIQKPCSVCPTAMATLHVEAADALATCQWEQTGSP